MKLFQLILFFLSLSSCRSDRSHHHHHSNSLNLNSSSANNTSQLTSNGSGGGNSSNVAKKPRLDLSKNSNGSLPSSSKPDAILDPSNSEHVIVVTQLKDQINVLQKQVKSKESELLDRDKKVKLFVVI